MLMSSKAVKISKGTYLFIVISLVHSKFWNCTIEKILKTRIIENSWYYQILYRYCSIRSKYNRIWYTQQPGYLNILLPSLFHGRSLAELPASIVSVCVPEIVIIKTMTRHFIFFIVFSWFVDLLAGLHYSDCSKTIGEKRNFMFLIHQQKMWNVYGQ